MITKLTLCLQFFTTLNKNPGQKAGSGLWPVTRPDQDPNCWPGDPVTRDQETRFHLCVEPACSWKYHPVPWLRASVSDVRVLLPTQLTPVFIASIHERMVRLSWHGKLVTCQTRWSPIPALTALDVVQLRLTAIYQSAALSTLSVCLSVLSVCLSVCLSIYLSIYLSIHLSAMNYLFVYCSWLKYSIIADYHHKLFIFLCFFNF